MTFDDTSIWVPFREPLRNTLLRTGIIALVGGIVFSFWAHNWARLPAAIVLMLWFSFGGHWVEILFLNVLRPRLPVNRVVQIAARFAVWFAGGTVLALGMLMSARAMNVPMRWPAWWLWGLVFIGAELIAHAVMLGRGLRCFYNGRG